MKKLFIYFLLASVPFFLFVIRGSWKHMYQLGIMIRDTGDQIPKSVITKEVLIIYGGFILYVILTEALWKVLMK